MMKHAKKHFGQHFLINKKIAHQITNSLESKNYNKIIEIGPGKGALTQLLINKCSRLKLVEIDADCVETLKSKFEKIDIIHGDFLKLDLKKIGFEKYAIIGNFPYNISSQILFKVLDNRDQIVEVVGMFQKEVADRICSKPNSKKYGILSVLMQAYFNCQSLFDVDSTNFYPRPRVNSSVIKLVRNNVSNLNCNHNDFMLVIKEAFSQRRKKIKNALKKITTLENRVSDDIMLKRAEELDVSDFIKLTNLIFKKL